jgi:aspartate aminotransferase
VIKATINMNFHSLKPAASIAMMDKARSMKAAGINVISLAGGEPDFDTPVHITDAAVRALRDGQTHYTTGRGIGKLRERIAEKLRVDNGIECNSSNILVTPGGKYSIFTVLITLINPGDEVLILDPSWLSYGPMVQIAGGVPVRIPLSFDNNYEITEELLEQNVSEKTRIMIINTPNNPTGRVLSGINHGSY